MVAWEDGAQDYGNFELCVIRSTWNYIRRRDDFLGWAESAARLTRLKNSWETVRWNTDKSYLKDLAKRGINIVPTAFVARGSEQPLAAIAAERGWTDVVVKPRVGAASFLTRRFGPARLQEGGRFLRRLAARRDALVQPYVASVENMGESCLVWIGGEITHAVRKSPRFSGDREETVLVSAIAPDEKAFALKIIEPYAPGLLYARVDLARDEKGECQLMELELVEPSLFLRLYPPALKRFVQACLAAAI